MSTSGNPDFYPNTRSIQRRLRSWALRRGRDDSGVDRVQRANLDTRRPRAIQILRLDWCHDAEAYSAVPADDNSRERSAL